MYMGDLRWRFCHVRTSFPVWPHGQDSGGHRLCCKLIFSHFPVWPHGQLIGQWSPSVSSVKVLVSRLATWSRTTSDFKSEGSARRAQSAFVFSGSRGGSRFPTSCRQLPKKGKREKERSVKDCMRENSTICNTGNFVQDCPESRVGNQYFKVQTVPVWPKGRGLLPVPLPKLSVDHHQ